jgi:hypothetical protein
MSPFLTRFNLNIKYCTLSHKTSFGNFKILQNLLCSTAVFTNSFWPFQRTTRKVLSWAKLSPRPSFDCKIHKTVDLTAGCWSPAQSLASFFFLFLAGYSVFCHSFSFVANFVFLRDVWIRTQRAAVASRRATNLATHLDKV